MKQQIRYDHSARLIQQIKSECQSFDHRVTELFDLWGNSAVRFDQIMEQPPLAALGDALREMEFIAQDLKYVDDSLTQSRTRKAIEGVLCAIEDLKIEVI